MKDKKNIHNKRRELEIAKSEEHPVVHTVIDLMDTMIEENNQNQAQIHVKISRLQRILDLALELKSTNHFILMRHGKALW